MVIDYYVDCKGLCPEGGKTVKAREILPSVDVRKTVLDYRDVPVAGPTVSDMHAWGGKFPVRHVVKFEER